MFAVPVRSPLAPNRTAIVNLRGWPALKNARPFAASGIWTAFESRPPTRHSSRPVAGS